MFPEIFIKLRTFRGPNVPVLSVTRHRPRRKEARILLRNSRMKRIHDYTRSHLLITDIR
ncbi:Hypothetical protein FKW44_009488 [Caligus rogercresseyi]|uniref:Uncharacterized protein n=1 Tax=Caligus rogercresseyi TaxID=217165 RepID=A0A7T8HF81_CALRO|nr:Hypothetical protein FKW44_009488 [Caligus rogercresseyi]